VNRVLGLALAGLLAIGVLGAIVYSIASRAGVGSQPVVTVRGVIGSEKQAFFRDPQVTDVFYLSIGIGKTPMVMVYEAQYVALQLAHDRALTSEMTLMYPSPTVLSKHTLIPLRPAGDRVGRLLVIDPPAYDPLETMISEIELLYRQGAIT
jgi:hypothetical protein